MTRVMPNTLTQGRFPTSSRGEDKRKVAPRTTLTSIPEADVLPLSDLSLDQEILASVLPEIDAFQKQQFDLLWTQGLSHVENMWKNHAAKVAQMQANVAEFVEGGKKLEEESRALRQLMVQALSCLRAQHEEQHRDACFVGINPVNPASIALVEQPTEQPPSTIPTMLVHAPPPGLYEGFKAAQLHDGLRDSSSRFNSSLNSDEAPLAATEANVEDIPQQKLESVSAIRPSESIMAEGVWTSCEENVSVKPLESFNLTLRRMDNLPLGFMVISDDKNEFLTVEKVLSNSVVAAWNAQNVGEKREILRNDRIASVNGKRLGKDMRDELANARILKLIVERSEGASGKTSCF